MWLLPLDVGTSHMQLDPLWPVPQDCQPLFTVWLKCQTVLQCQLKSVNSIKWTLHYIQFVKVSIVIWKFDSRNIDMCNLSILFGMRRMDIYW